MIRLLTGILGAICLIASMLGARLMFDLQFSASSGSFFGSVSVPLWLWASLVGIGLLGAATLNFAVRK